MSSDSALMREGTTKFGRFQISMIWGHTFLSNQLNAQAVVIDLGANVGNFASRLFALFNCQCYSVEPTPEYFAQIETNAKLKKYNYAITNKNGPVSFNLSENVEGSSIYSQEENVSTITVEGVTLEAFLKIASLEVVDLLKIDIEGAEKDLFDTTSDSTLLNMKQITIEFHDFIPAYGLEEEVKKIKARLQKLGFYCIPFYSYTRNMDVLFINKKLVKFSYPDYLFLKYVGQYLALLHRIGVKRAIEGVRNRFSFLLKKSSV